MISSRDTGACGDAAPQRDEDLVETQVCSERVFDGRLLKVFRDTVRLPNGREGIREYVRHPGAVVVVALPDRDHAIMLRQYRYSVQRVILEFPAGKLDAGEDPLACAQRELLEETGYEARHWVAAGRMHLAVGYSDEVIHIFFATGLRKGEARPDEDEFVHLQTVPVPDILQRCRDGAITDAKSLTCALWLQNVLDGRWVLDGLPEPGEAA